MGNNFRNIDYGRVTYEAMRNYFAVNAAGNMSILYKFVAACVAPLQPTFNAYVTFRTKEALIASCKWQIGQLTNVLNYLFDPADKRIYISQSIPTGISLTTFQYNAIQEAQEWGGTTTIQLREFADRSSITVVTINVPAGINMADIVATINQIRIQGIPYQINII